MLADLSSIILLAICGCSTGKMITVPLDSTPLSEIDATVIVFHDQGYPYDFPLYIGKERIGTVTSETPLKFMVTPGSHDLHSEAPSAVDRVEKHSFEAGKIYHMQIRIIHGFWISSVKIEMTSERASYEVRSYK